MKVFLALVRRELAERRGVVGGVAAMVALPLLVRLLPGLRPETAREAQGTLALLASFTLPAALAGGLGAAAVGEDLARGRLGFYFSRPLSAWRLWAAKMAVPVLLALAAWALLLPQLSMASGKAGPFSALEEPVVMWWPAVLVALVLLANVGSVAYRARDGLFWLDLAAMVAVAVVSLAVGWRLYEAGAMAGVWYLLVLLAAALTVSAGLAGALQLAHGRSDVRRGHRILSSVFWGGIGAAVLAGAGFAAWVLAAGPADLGVNRYGGAIASPEGSVVAFPTEGGRAGYQPVFLLDTASGHVDALPLERLSGLGLSADGGRAVWVEDGHSPVLVVARLGPGGWSRSTASLPPATLGAPAVWMVGLDPDARRAVVATSERIWVVDVESGAELASAAVSWARRAAFTGSSLRVYGLGPRSGEATITSLDLRSEKASVLAQVDGADWVCDVRGGRALVGRRGKALSLVEEDGTVRSLLEVEPPFALGDAGLLSHGRVAAVVSRWGGVGHGRTELVVWDTPDEEPRRLALPTGGWLGAEPLDGWLTLGQVHDRGRGTTFVDLEPLRVVRTEPGLVPILAEPSWLGPRGTVPPGTPGTRLFVTEAGGLVRLDPETGRREIVLRRSGAPEP
jgi:hypothetical protein